MLMRFVRRSGTRFLLAAGMGFLAAGCAGTAPPPAVALKPPPPQPEDHTVRLPPSAGVYKIGEPYQIDNVWYYPHEQPDYDETGIASWYGPTFYGKRTADGEIYDGDSLTAAHRTLPLPVNVRVTNLDNGKSIVVRVNDRGPYSQGRIIDLSRRAAELLDVMKTGTARVRVTYLGRADLSPGGAPEPETPPEIANALPAEPAGKVDSSILAMLSGAAVTRPAPLSTLPKPVESAPLQPVSTEPTGQVDQVPVPATTHLYVQVGAFANLANARRLAMSLGGDLRISTLQRGGQTLYRVRTGPLASVEEADAALSRIIGQATDARIVVDQ
jgi:rare lipoprotein A